ncbi:hypothetical protein H6G45_06385 [Synechocystis sp. FACHB-383]|uniref:hypothetical protein n=1 Tax=Synechocystis sp. FACHB-383 TaxID=2692864 RepID=UPI00168954A4|nr:hypothetical protein [Synechocystis sp. FACHB-383]MBD2653120.1 hypothetical protein [Synechocystis sp. FACHB-383]
MSKVLSQQQQIDELRARLQALEEQANGWKTVPEAAQILGVSATFIRDRLKLRSYKKAHQKMGRNYRIHIETFRQQLAKEKA